MSLPFEPSRLGSHGLNNSSEFTLQLAPVRVNGMLVDVPAVTFLRKSSVYYPAQLM
jgi:hypothetical protein